ncbi:hypothetical protein AYM40_34050 [Paraburkholderia phytofirmans OLGA172]|uniref:Uncharacterized protein n=1 Tax=Paraburkholderia phytofirmans OLGA172 TaxID=1417228 RepID=A0A160FV12_9BURK|nr:hypothetical protein [Paraburkholderia phytofirmans]ANB77135.1 hypothetical protein AYM40_34050 [Paraburkholderia phytofirmans OLGA172]
MASVVLYGDLLHFLNGFQNFDGGYLDSCGLADLPASKLNVVTATTPNRDGHSGTWRIESAEGKAFGSEVKSCDSVYLFNLHQGDGGYLGTNNIANPPELYRVVTANKSERPNDVLTWRLIVESTEGYDGKLREDNVVRLLNDYDNTRGGFLDSCENSTHPNTRYQVFTSVLSNRGVNFDPSHMTGLWKVSKQKP